MEKNKWEVAVIGGGPSGLAAAIEAAKAGCDVLVIDSNEKAGGQLFKQIHKFFGSNAHRAGVRGIDIGDELLEEAKNNGVEIWLNSVAIGLFPDKTIAVEVGNDIDSKIVKTINADKIILAGGASENAIRFNGWTLPGVMGAGAAQTMVNTNKVLPGKKILMIGSGNVGLIVSYQLMQGGADVVGLVEAAPSIGGYAVHAAKIARAGVPIKTRYTVIEARGKERVEEADICQVDENWQPILSTKETLKVDTIAIAVGLKPLGELAQMYGCEMLFNPVQGGWVPIHDSNMESTQEGIYVVGDITGVEEANTALEEGKLAGVSAAESLSKIPTIEADKAREEIWERLDSLRLGPHGIARKNAKDEQIHAWDAAVNNK